MLKSKLVDTIETLKDWQIQEEIVPYKPIDSCLPEGTLGCVEVSEHKKIAQIVYYSSKRKMREAQITVFARYFPEIYNPDSDYSTCQITKDSYDYAQVCIDMVYEGKIYTQRKRVGLHWKKVTFDIILPAFTEHVELKVYSTGYPIQVAKVSMKEMEK